MRQLGGGVRSVLLVLMATHLGLVACSDKSGDDGAAGAPAVNGTGGKASYSGGATSVVGGSGNTGTPNAGRDNSGSATGGATTSGGTSQLGNGGLNAQTGGTGGGATGSGTGGSGKNSGGSSGATGGGESAGTSTAAGTSGKASGGTTGGSAGASTGGASTAGKGGGVGDGGRTNASGGQANGGGAGRAGGGSSGADDGNYPDISFAGLTTAVELAPVRLAATGVYPGKVTINSGGVDNLFNSNPALIATNAETQALRSSVQHPNLRIVFTVCEGLYRVVGKKSAGIKTLTDLKGKTVDYSPGTSSAYFLHKILATVNLSESDVRAGGTPSGNSSGDAAAFWEPNMEQYSAARGSDAIEFQKDDQGHEIYRELFNLHATAESLADASKRRTIVRFVRALIAASEQIQNDPSSVYSIMTGPTGVSQATLAGSFKYERYAGTLVTDLVDVLAEEEVWHAKNNNRTARSRAEIEKLVDTSVLKEATGN